MAALNPVEYIILCFGTERSVASALGVNQSNVNRWKRKGRIPCRYHIPLLAIIKEREMPVSMEQLVLGVHLQPHEIRRLNKK